MLRQRDAARIPCKCVRVQDTKEVDLYLEFAGVENSNEKYKVGERLKEVVANMKKFDLVWNTCTRHVLSSRSTNLNYEKL